MAYSYSSEKELILFSDESITKGEFYSNFYGGVLVGASQYLRIQKKLENTRGEAGIKSEIKWSKVTPDWLDGYKKIIDAFFEEILAEKLKVRIMFRQNAHTPINLTSEQKEHQYFLLYYQFIKNAFGLDKLKPVHSSMNLRFFFDQFPDKKEKSELFKDHIMNLQDFKFKGSGLQIKRENINEARSHEHIILQCLDVVLGSMAFRLNDRHKIKPEGKRVRGKRTIAKEELYKHIRNHICKIKSNFNIGTSTAGTSQYPDRADLPYAHWMFIPRQSRFEPSFTKNHKKKN